MKISNKTKLSVDYGSIPHNRKIAKPNEDKLIVDEENKIFILLDGITRPHSEYEMRPNKSYAKDYSEEFADSAYTYIVTHMDELEPEELLTNAVKTANNKLCRMKAKIGECEFYPGTLGIISIIKDERLHYVCVGDSLAVLIRKTSRLVFGRELPLEAVDLHNVSKAIRYETYCNHPENHLSYTIFNGDDVVMDGLEYSFIDLCESDVLFLGSDGIGSCLKYEKIQDLKVMTVEEIFKLSEKYDIPPYAEYADDKTLIKLTF